MQVLYPNFEEKDGLYLREPVFIFEMSIDSRGSQGWVGSDLYSQIFTQGLHVILLESGVQFYLVHSGLYFSQAKNTFQLLPVEVWYSYWF